MKILKKLYLDPPLNPYITTFRKLIFNYTDFRLIYTISIVLHNAILKNLFDNIEKRNNSR